MSADTLAARIRERAMEYRLKNQMFDGGIGIRRFRADEVEELMAAFALSELSAAEKAERERCCADVCHHCRSKSDKYITRAKKADGKWIHEEVGFEKERGGFDCYAASIRNRE